MALIPGSSAWRARRHLPSAERAAIMRRSEGAQNSAGEPSVTWATLQYVYLTRVLSAGGPVVEGSQEFGSSSVTLLCPDGTDIRPGDRVAFDGGATYEVKATETVPGVPKSVIAIVSRMEDEV